MNRTRRILGRPWFIGVLVAGLVAVAAGLYWFQPWQLWVDETVQEALPLPAAAAAPASLPPRPAEPAGLATGGRRVRAMVYFKIGRRGEVTGVRLEGVSGIEFFDRSALRAVTISDPLPPLPDGFGGGELGVHFGFDWETP